MKKTLVTMMHLVYHLRYIKDPRTGACFAYYGYPGNYSSVMATVPCETVPSHLLITPKVN